MALFDLLAGDKPKVPAPKDPNEGERNAVLRVLRGKRQGENVTILNAVTNAARETGISPQMLGASALQEGMDLAYINRPDERSGAFTKAQQQNKALSKYNVDGFLSFGLDNFADKYPELRKSGYLKRDLDFAAFPGVNNKGPVNTAAFRSTQDALMAKGAFLKSLQDQVAQKASQMKLKLDNNTLDYLTMAAYNGGFGNAKMMMDELASGKYKQSDYVSKGLTSRQGVHKNISPRIMKMGWITEELSKMR